MNKTLKHWMSGAAMAITVAGLFAGCSNRTQRERNALWRQNQELQDELNRSRAALDTQAGAPETAQQTQTPSQATPPPTASTTPANPQDFAGIQGVQSQMRGSDVEVTVASDILFAPGQARLSNTAKKTLSKVADVLKQKYADNPITVEGHTDTDPIRKSHWKSNQALSEARAASVADYLAKHGIDRSRMQTVGYGSTRPKSTKAKSRRVEIVVMPVGTPLTKGLGSPSAEQTQPAKGVGGPSEAGPTQPTKGIGPAKGVGESNNGAKQDEQPPQGPVMFK